MERPVEEKALIIKNNQFLMLWPRANGPVGKKGKNWEIPTGPHVGSKSSEKTLAEIVKKACSLKIDVLRPVKMYTYKKNGQEILVIIFACKYLSGKVKLDKKYSSYRWVDADKTKHVLPGDAADEEIINLGIG
jgi:hypothetical protein